MLIIGLTGSIGMGKTTTAQMFADEGLPVYDSDAAVHRLYGPGGAAVRPLAAAFPEALAGDKIDRARLSAVVLGDAAALNRVQEIVHPLVVADQRQWLEEQARAGAGIVVLDIPLLFETGAEDRVDVTVVVSAPEEIQRQRVLKRPGMTDEKLQSILTRQMPDPEKRQRADLIVETGEGLEHARRQVASIIAAMKDRPGHIWKT